nr:Ers1 [Starmerella bombicola]
MRTNLELVSNVCGWGYVICWGVSLYPPLLLNYHTRSVEGVSLDFAYLNFWGCLFYLASVSMMFFSTTVKLEYALAHTADARRLNEAPKQPLVRFNDVVYGFHSLLLVIGLLYQFYCSGYRRSSTQTLSRSVKLISLAGVICALLLILHAYEISTTRRHYQLVDVANIFGTVKVFFSGIKYIPQAYFIYQRKSVRGFAVKGCITDIVGGLLCSLQLLIDAYLVNDLGGVLKHPTKLLLAVVAMFFGFVFIAQYKIYSKEEEPSIYNKKTSKLA